MGAKTNPFFTCTFITARVALQWLLQTRALRQVPKTTSSGSIRSM
jgi:hypothetical protein